MIKIATPVSNFFVDRDAADRILAASDLLEGRDHTHDIRLDQQGLFHFELSVVNVWSERDRLWVERIVHGRRSLELISFHVASSCSHPVMDGIKFKEGGRIFSRQELLENAAGNIAWLKKLVAGRGIVIAVENNNYYPTSAYAHVTGAEFIERVVVDNDIGFLFDVAHARITALNSSVPYEQYCAGLPMRRAWQVHVSQWGMDDRGMACDAHEIPGDLLNEEVAVLVKKFGIRYVTVEYYRDLEKLLGTLRSYRVLLGKGEV